MVITVADLAVKVENMHPTFANLCRLYHTPDAEPQLTVALKEKTHLAQSVELLWAVIFINFHWNTISLKKR